MYLIHALQWCEILESESRASGREAGEANTPATSASAAETAAPPAGRSIDALLAQEVTELKEKRKVRWKQMRWDEMTGDDMT